MLLLAVGVEEQERQAFLQVEQCRSPGPEMFAADRLRIKGVGVGTGSGVSSERQKH